MVNPTRDPELDPRNDPARPVYPGSIERDIVTPSEQIDPRVDPRMNGSSRGLTGAAVVVAIVLIAIAAFSFFGSGSTDQASVPAGDGPVVQGTDNPPTASITPEPQQPAEPAPASPPPAAEAPQAAPAAPQPAPAQ